MTRLLFRFLLPGLLFATAGCATLAVTPADKPKISTKQEGRLGIQVAGERMRAALTSPESFVTSSSGRLYDSVVLLPPEASRLTPDAIRSAYGADYILTATISDVSVKGGLNPIWFASMPLLFFKPYAPIVTFDATVTIDAALRDARSGAVILKRESSSSATDHFSPINPEEKVRGLIGRSINNAFTAFMNDIPRTKP